MAKNCFLAPRKQVPMLPLGFSRSEIAPPPISAVTVVLAEKGARGGEVDSVCVCVMGRVTVGTRQAGGHKVEGPGTWMSS